MIFKILGYAVMTIVTGTGIVVALGASWFLFIGGVLDIFTDRTLNSGIDWVDDWNRDHLISWGSTAVGLFKIFVVEPVVVTVIGIGVAIGNAAGAGLVVLGTRDSSHE